MGLVRVYGSNKMNFNLLNPSPVLLPSSKEETLQLRAWSSRWRRWAAARRGQEWSIWAAARAQLRRLVFFFQPVKACPFLSPLTSSLLFLLRILIFCSSVRSICEFTEIPISLSFLKKMLLHNLFAFWLVRKICGYCTLLPVLTLASWLLDVIKFSFDFFAVVD